MKNFHIQWAIHTLKEYGYQIHHAIPEKILDTPWSEVCRFVTDKGLIYLKKVPPALSLESNMIRVLYEQFRAPVPLLIADNHELHCFLMQDAGIPLHDFFKHGFQAELLIQTMHKYSAMQIMTANQVELFLSQGVPDWRLEKLPQLYQVLIAQENLLLEDGLTKEELKKLEKLDSKLFSICKQLSHYAIPETLGHCDFHDKNILVDIHTHQTTVIDLGEIAITHPFFSLLNCLHRASENFGLTDYQYQQLQKECFKPWLSLETQTHLFEVLSFIHQCWSIHAVLGEYRLINSVDSKSSLVLSRQGRLANKLRFWIE